MLPAVLIALLAAFFAGLALLWAGLRGRRINDHPVCRQCAFDLMGVYPEGVTCPECGAGLKRVGGVRFGARRRMVGVALLGAMLAVLPLPPVGVVAFAALTGSDVNAYKPLGLILWEARRADKARTAKLAGEVMSRWQAGSLSAAQQQTVLDAVLAMQSDPAVTWDEAWGDFIERAKLDGVLAAGQEEQFNAQAAAFAVRTRPRVRAGQVLPLRITPGTHRLASTTSLLAQVTLAGAAIDGRSLEQAPVPEADAQNDVFGMPTVTLFGTPGADDASLGTISLAGSRAAGLPLAFGSLRDLALVVPEDLAPGRHRLTIDLDLATSAGGRGAFTMAFVNGRLARGPQGATDTHRVTLTTEIDVVRDDEAIVTAVAPTPEMTKAMAKALEPVRLSVAASGLADDDRRVARTAIAGFDLENLPIPGAFDVYIRAGEREVRLGSFDSAPKPSAAAGAVFSSVFTVMINGTTTTTNSEDSAGRAMVRGDIAGVLPGDRVDLVLRPSESRAAAALDLDSFYNGEIVIPGVTVDESVSHDPFERMRSLERDMQNRLQRFNTLPPQPRARPSGPF